MSLAGTLGAMSDRRSKHDVWTPPKPFEIPTLETERLVVRAYRLEDAPAVYEAVAASREHLHPWMPWAKGHQDLAETTKYVTEQVVAPRTPETLTDVGMGVFERDTGRFVGGSGFHNLDRAARCVETGYWVRADRVGRGYAGEACARVISWLLTPQARRGLGLDRVVLFCLGQNERSVRTIEKIGLRKELHQRRHKHADGLGVCDWLGWGVLRDEWDSTNHRPA